METLKLVVVGDGSVGKTCQLIAYVTRCFPKEFVPSVFDNYTTTVMVDGQPISLCLCDTAGQEAYDQIRPLAYPETDVFLICFAINNKTSFDNITDKWIPEIETHCPDIPIVIVGCKMDLRQTDPENCLQKSVAEEKATELGLPYCETSALTQEGLMTCFDKAILEGIMACMSREEDDPEAEPKEGQEEEGAKVDNNESPDPFMTEMQNPFWKEMQNPVYKGSKNDAD